MHPIPSIQDKIVCHTLNCAGLTLCNPPCVHILKERQQNTLKHFLVEVLGLFSWLVGFFSKINFL